MTDAGIVMFDALKVASRDVELMPRPYRVHKGKVPHEIPIDGPTSRMAIGGPVWRRLIPEASSVADPHGLLENSEPSLFYLVHLTATFMPALEEPFKAAEIALTLTTENAQGDEAIAWSLAPDALIDKVTTSREVRLGTSLQIVGLGPFLPSGHSEWTRSASIDRRQAFLLAGNELRTDPYWRLRETDVTKIEGMVRLLMVVRGPKDLPVKGTIRASTWIERKRYGLWAYDVRLPDADSIAFTLK
jgi:hypothetical protein